MPVFYNLYGRKNPFCVLYFRRVINDWYQVRIPLLDGPVTSVSARIIIDFYSLRFFTITYNFWNFWYWKIVELDSVGLGLLLSLSCQIEVGIFAGEIEGEILVIEGFGPKRQIWRQFKVDLANKTFFRSEFSLSIIKDPKFYSSQKASWIASRSDFTMKLTQSLRLLKAINLASRWRLMSWRWSEGIVSSLAEGLCSGLHFEAWRNPIPREKTISRWGLLISKLMARSHSRE